MENTVESPQQSGVTDPILPDDIDIPTGSPDR